MEKLARFPFSLTAFLLAPWPAPLLCSVLLTLAIGSHRLIAVFLFILSRGLIVSYLGTAVLVACLWGIASIRTITKIISAFTGIGVALLGYIPFIFVNWHASDPGFEEDSFAAHLLRSLNEPLLYICTGAGLLTALLYDLLARRSSKRGNLKNT